MRIVGEQLVTSATDLATYMGCGHATALDKQVALKLLDKPDWQNPILDALIERGQQHEAEYLRYLKEQGKTGCELSMDSPAGDLLAAMRSGVQYIYQAQLTGDGWQGYADFLIRCDTPSNLGDWSYEVLDAKLARETRGETILQLCIYSELLNALQGCSPANAYVLTPGDFEPETYRLAEYAAYYRLIKKDFEEFVPEAENAKSYPEPVDKCDRCRWFGRCNKQRRSDDHLTFVAGIHRSQRDELVVQGITTLKQLAEMPIPIEFKPGKGTREALERVREQARLQLHYRESEQRIYELLALEEGQGLYRLPEPSPGDVFFDIEGDAFVGEHGFEYLFGYDTVGADGALTYHKILAANPAAERQLFDDFMRAMQDILAAHPDMHIFHYHSYEPSALKRLAGRYAMHQDLLDTLLRTERFVDLHRIVRHTLRASVEKYSIKDLEPFFNFERQIPLPEAGDARHQLEAALELGHSLNDVPPGQLQQVVDYNEDDCVATFHLYRWLEQLRQEQLDNGCDIPRPAIPEEKISPELSEKLQEIRDLANALQQKIPADEKEHTQEDHAIWLLSHLLEFYRREEKATWWEYFRLDELEDEERLDEKAAVAGLRYLTTVEESKTGIPTDQYAFPPQDLHIKQGDTLHHDKQKWGVVEEVDLLNNAITVKKMKKTADWHLPSAYAHDIVPTAILESSIIGQARAVLANLDAPVDEPTQRPLTLELLANTPVSLAKDKDLHTARSHEETELDLAKTIVTQLDRSVLGIQGPPGTGKTYTGAHMILTLVAAGKKVGITGPSHKAIRNLLNETVKLAKDQGTTVKAVQKSGNDEDKHPMIELGDNAGVAKRIRDDADIAAGTAWLFARAEMQAALDVLFIDEAGQFSLAHTCAVAQSANSLVLLGDPQQLDQPLQGTHPPGVERSGLQHLLGKHATMPPDRGLFLPETWRMHPAICDYISEVFYEGKLEPEANMKHQKLVHPAYPQGAGLWFIPVAHANNQNASVEEAGVIRELVERLLAEGSWINKDGKQQTLKEKHVLIVTPYNAQVAEICKQLPDIQVGTVDKFQGQEAPVVIMSYATSTPEDAPRGMDFLYSLNRLNVAVSRARCATFVVANPELIRPECKKPRHMRLANGLARYVEYAKQT